MTSPPAGAAPDVLKQECCLLRCTDRPFQMTVGSISTCDATFFVPRSTVAMPPVQIVSAPSSWLGMLLYPARTRIRLYGSKHAAANASAPACSQRTVTRSCFLAAHHAWSPLKQTASVSGGLVALGMNLGAL